MRTESEAITGAEAPRERDGPVGALQAFHYAFNHRDLERMAESWEQSGDVVMDNPLGGVERGWPDIAAVYRRILESSAEVPVEFADDSLHRAGDLLYAVGRERGWYRSGSGRLDLATRTTPIFRRVGPRRGTICDRNLGHASRSFGIHVLGVDRARCERDHA